MDGAGDHFLAGARFAGDHDRQVERRDAADHVADGVDRAARRADQAGQAEAAFDLFLLALDLPFEHRFGVAQIERQALVFLLQTPDFGGALQGQQQLLGLPGLEQVLPDAGLVDAGDDVLGVGIAGKDDAHDVRPAGAHFLEKLDAGRPRHALVAEHDAERPDCSRRRISMPSSALDAQSTSKSSSSVRRKASCERTSSSMTRMAGRRRRLLWEDGRVMPELSSRDRDGGRGGAASTNAPSGRRNDSARHGMTGSKP